MTDAEEFIRLAEWDWVTTLEGRFLHHLKSLDFPEVAGIEWGGPGVVTCGVHSIWISIPGIFSRMGARRCKKCCKILGWPTGLGSPKNDDTMRELVEARLDKME